MDKERVVYRKEEDMGLAFEFELFELSTDELKKLFEDKRLPMQLREEAAWLWDLKSNRALPLMDLGVNRRSVMSGG